MLTRSYTCPSQTFFLCPLSFTPSTPISPTPLDTNRDAHMQGEEGEEEEQGVWVLHTYRTYDSCSSQSCDGISGLPHNDGSPRRRRRERGKLNMELSPLSA